jgi:hypothetical protein
VTIRRLLDAPLAAHAAALAVLLLLLLPVIGTSSQFSADEGAAIAQAEQLARGDGWTSSHPFPEADPSGGAYPFELSSRSGDRYAPFVKHPVYPAILSGASRVAGRAGMVALSLAGTVLAAVLGALVGRRVDRALAVPALWVLGLASPLFFDGYLVIAHSIGAALAAGATLCVLVALEEPRRAWPYPVLLLAIAAGTVMRNEMALFAAALSIAVVVAGRPLRVRSALLCLTPLVGAAIGWLGDRMLADVIMGGPSTSTPGLSTASGGKVASKVFAFVITWLLPSYSLGPRDAVLLGAVVFGAIAASIARKRPEDRQGITVFASASAGAAVLRLLLGAGPVPGLLLAFPLLALGLVAVGRHRALPATARLCAWTFTLFSLAVLATQYGSGGSGEWGGRYFAVGLPLIVPVVLLALRDVGRALDRRTLRVALVSSAVLSLSLSAVGVVTLRSFHANVDHLVAAVDRSTGGHPASDGGAPVVLSTNGAAARFAFRSVERTRWLTVDVDDAASYASRLHDLGVGEITFVTKDEDDLAALGTAYRVVAEERPGNEWVVASLAPT